MAQPVTRFNLSGIRIGEHWDGQGHQGLDGWAWYSKQLTVPEDANYMIFTGVDDYFEVYVDGQMCDRGRFGQPKNGLRHGCTHPDTEE